MVIRLICSRWRIVELAGEANQKEIKTTWESCVSRNNFYK